MNGISSQASGIIQNKEKTFQGQRFDDDLELNWVQFKWRNHDIQIGRFIEIDPLSEEYKYNSTYAFSENKVTAHIELEGLEATLATSGLIAAASDVAISFSNIITAGNGGSSTAYDLHKDAGTFLRTANALAKQVNSGALQINDGNSFVNLLETTTKIKGEVNSFVNYAHSGPNGLFYNNNEGFYTENSQLNGQASNVKMVADKIANGTIKFSKNAIGILGGCNTNASSYENHGIITQYSGVKLAESIATQLKIPIIAADNKVNLIEKNGNLKTDGNFYLLTPILKERKISFFGLNFTSKVFGGLETKKLGKVIAPKNYIQ